MDFSLGQLLPPEGSLFLNNKFISSASNSIIDVINPANEEIIYKIPKSNKFDIEEGVNSAKKAFFGWEKVHPRQRGLMLYKIGELIQKYKHELAYLETINVGKPISATLNREIPRAFDVVTYYAGWCDKISGSTNQISKETTLFTLEEPIGVVGAIIPWNFPLTIALYKIAPALACGNTVVLKPSEYSPLSALFLGKIIQEAGLPEGVINIIPGDGTTGAHLVNSDVDKIAFTGSINTGKQIMYTCADSVKRVQLELGGKSPNVIFEDASIDKAIDSSLHGIFYNCGQVCIAGSRLFVHKQIHDEVLNKITDKMASMIVDDPLKESTTMGPLANKMQYNKVLSFMNKAKSDNAKLITGGSKIDRKGFFVKPTIYTEVTQNMTIANEEIFGPVLSCIEFENTNELISMANSTVYGLAAGCWTNNINKAITFAKNIKAGIVWINSFYSMDPVSPFGGFKQSGFGRDLGKEALNNYTETKSILIYHGT